METQESLNYHRIAKAIEYLKASFKEQPSLDEAASHVHLSPFHFHRMFKEWSGITPKEFLQFLTIEHAKGLLKDESLTIADAAFETGLSGTGRLHDLFIKIEGMTPGEFRNGGESLSINYSFAESPFGTIIVASTEKGICYMAFADDDPQAALNELIRLFPNAGFQNLTDKHQQNALFIFTQDWSKLPEIKLHLKGTAFQIRVWQALLSIPIGGLSTYSGLASKLQNPLASRAVGSAVGANPVAFLIPCHRIVRATGEFGQYHWGALRKTMMIGWESTKMTYIR